MKKFTDPVTQKTISYEDNDLFIIKTRMGKNKRIVKRIFQAVDVARAFSEFYAFPTPPKCLKYLFQVTPQHKQHEEGTILLRFRNQSEAFLEREDTNVRLRYIKPKFHMRVKSIANLMACPVSMFLELEKLNEKDFPTSTHKWTRVKMIYALIAHFLSLSKEEQYNLLIVADKELLKHKELSGYPVEEDNMIKVDVVVKDDLL